MATDPQPIETAPKDGEALFRSRTRAHWFQGFLYDLYPNCAVEPYSGRVFPCTHWMPIPKELP